jgi:murein L,D-transpeptidase YcbB/YkuD
MNKRTSTLAAALAVALLTSLTNAPAHAEGQTVPETPTVTSGEPTVSRADATRARLEARAAAQGVLDEALDKAKKKRANEIKQANKLRNKVKRTSAIADAQQTYFSTARAARTVYLAAVAKARADYEKVTGTGIQPQ